MKGVPMVSVNMRAAYAFALLSVLLFLAQSGTPVDIDPGVATSDAQHLGLSAVYWPSIGRDHAHRSEGSPAQRGIADPVVKWDHASNSTSLGTVGANFTGNVAFSGVAAREVFGVASSNSTHLQVRDSENGTLMWSIDVRKVEGKITNRLYVSPAVIDTDSDLKKEVFCVISDGSSYQGVLFEPVVRLNASGFSYEADAFFTERIWMTEVGPQGASRYSSPVAYDITGDSVEDLIFGGGNYLICIDGSDGGLQWQRQIGPFGEVLSSPAVYLAGSPALNRIVVNSLISPAKNAIRTTLVNFYGVHLNNVTYDMRTAYSGEIPLPSIGDLTGDSEKEIVCVYPGTTGSGRIRVFSYTLALLNVTSISGFLEASCALSNMDQDPELEILIGSRFFTTRPNVRMTCLELYRSGTEWLSRPLWTTESAIQLWTEVYSPPLVCDMDSDSRQDVVFFAEGSVFCLDEAGRMLWNISAGHIFRNAGVVGDLGRDQFTDVLCDGILISQRIVDLTISPSDIVLSDQEPVEGRELVISCIVVNEGNSPAADVLVTYTDMFNGDELLIGNDSLSQVVSTRESTIRWTPLKDGTHDLIVTVDPLGTVTEDIETNNQASIEVQVKGSVPDLNVSDIRYFRADGAEVDGRTKNLVDGDPSKVMVTVVNLGYRMAEGFPVALAVDGEVIGTIEVESIPGGRSVNLTFQWTPDMPDGGSVLVSAFCDMPDLVVEASESNNNMTESTTIKSAQPSPASYLLTGTVRDPDGDLVAGARVTLKNNRTTESLAMDTNMAGAFLLDPAMLASGYLDGDQMELRATFGQMWGKMFLRVYSQDGGKAVSINLTAIPTTGLSLDPSGHLTLDVDPGTEKKMVFNVTNSGNVRSQVSISVDTEILSSNSTGWIASVDNSSFILDPDRSRVVTLTLLVPSDAAPADSISVVMACSVNGTVLASADILLTVKEMARLLIEMPQESEIPYDPNIGSPVELNVYIENVGNVEVDYSVEVVGDLDAIDSIAHGSGNLTPGDNVEPIVTLDMTGQTGTLYGEIHVRSVRANDAMCNISVVVLLPNLAVDGEIGADPPGRVLNEEIKLSIQVKNEGRTDIGSFSYAFFVDGVTLGKQSAEDLTSGGSAVLLGSWTPTKEGKYTITFKLDPENELSETDEDDNQAEREFTFYPDLIIKSCKVSEYRPSSGSTIWADVEVENRGSSAVGGYKLTVNVGSVVDPLFIKDYVKAVQPGESRTERIEFKVPSEPGKTSLDFRVDVPAGSTDQDTSNNKRTEQIEITSADGPNNLPWIIGGVIASLVVIGVGVFLLVRFGVITRDGAGEGPTGGTPPPEMTESSVEPPTVEMKLEAPPSQPPGTEDGVVEVEAIEVPDAIPAPGGPEDGLIPEV